MRKFIRFVLKHTYLMLAAGILITVFFTYHTRYLHIDNSVRTGFPSHNKDFQQLEAFLKEFGGDELIVVAVESDRIFSKKYLTAIDEVSRQIASLKMVLRVTSLTTVSDFVASAGRLRLTDLIERDEAGKLILPEDEQGLAQLRERILENNLYVNNIVSPDGRATAMVAHIESDPSDDAYKARLVREIKGVVQSSVLAGEQFHLAGPPVFTTEMERCVSHDLRYFTPVVVLMIGALLFYVFRSWRSVLLPLLTVMMCVLWTAGTMQLTTGRITIASTILPPLMIAIGVAMVVHVFAQYQDELQINLDRRPALEETISHVGWPCLLTAVTTAIGFASLSVSEIPAIIETGLFASFGVMVAYLIAIAFVPSVLLHTKVRQKPVETVHPYLIRGLRGIAKFNEARPWVVVLITVVLVAVSAWGISRLEVETNLINYFSPKTEVRQAQDFVSERLGGSITVDVVVRAPRGGTVASLELLEKVEELENHLSSYPAVGKVFSLASVVRAMNKELMGEERLWEELPFLAQQHFQSLKRARLEMGLFEHLVDENFTKLRVTARLHQVPSRELLEVVDSMEDYLASHFSGEQLSSPLSNREEERESRAGFAYSATLTGSTRIFVKMGHILVDGEIKGLALALVSIFVVITLLFRNLWMGLIAMVPNVVPIMITLAVMGFAKIPINVTTAMIPCIALGIAVDDTIHYVSRFKREFAEDGHYVNSMFRTLLSTGKPIVFTSLILFCGFITLAFSSFSCNAYFGILTSVTMISALLGDLVILPVLINILRPVRAKPEQ